MDLYTFVLVEPKPKPPEKEKTSTAVFLPLGNFPDGDTAPPWTDEQSEVVSKAVLSWYNNPPELGMCFSYLNTTRCGNSE